MGKRKKQAEGFISKASLKSVHLSPQKARLVADLVRGRRVGVALDILETCDTKAAPLIKKLILSAASSAKRNSNVDVDELMVKSAFVDGAGILHRFMPRAHGRATPIRKRFSKITVILDEISGRANG